MLRAAKRKPPRRTRRNNRADIWIGSIRTNQEIISERQQDAYDDKLAEYEAAADWEVKDKVWEQVSFDGLFTTTDPNAEEEEADYFDPDTGELLLGDIVININRVSQLIAQRQLF